MSRYYSIELYAPNAPLGASPVQTWTSYPNGVNDPGALNVELDLLTSFYGTPNGDVGNSTVTIDGVPLTDLLAASQFTDLGIIVRGGMKAGLPLANPLQAGILVSGQIFQSFGNWQGTDQNLNFVLTPTGYTLSTAGHFIFTWVKGQSLGSALTNTLSIAYPNYTIQMQIANTYTPPGGGPINTTAKTFTQFAKFITNLLKGAVNLTIRNNSTVVATDGTQQAQTVPLVFTDFVGQPTWVQPDTLQFTTIMRADIQMGTFVTMPKGLQDLPGIVTTAASALPSQLKYQTTFQGKFFISSVRHIGNFRDANGQSWVSIFQAVPQSVINAG